MRVIPIFLAVVLGTAKSAGDVSDEEKLYTFTVAVVEYLPIHNNSIPASERPNSNTLEYINLLKNVTKDLDLILFPEAILGVAAVDSTEVPKPFTEIVCNSADTKYKDYLKLISCAAIQYNTTVIVNIIEKENCTTNNSTGFCPSSGIIYYNSDVAFNESGGVSGRYRKWNLFGEYNKSPPAEVELVTIKTKNNDSFGIFTCFDIMFNQPALNLTRDLGLKNILFPTMWYSELPFLTALQVQQMWAVENNVNLMSAGANDPKVGSGGTGIFIGDQGPLAYEMVGGEGGSRIIVGNVPRPAIQNNPYRNVTPISEDIDIIAAEMDSFYLLADPSLVNYSSVILPWNETEVSETVCNGDDIKICCQFDIKMSVNKNITNGNVYTYHLTAFNGIRSFSGMRDGGIESCGVLACFNDSVSSCGRRISNYSYLIWPITFEKISVVANFSKDDNRIQFPNSLLSSIRPISPQYTSWEKEEINNVVKRSHVLNVPQNRLLTFGIFGRDFGRDSPNKIPPHNNTSTRLSSFNIIAVILTVFLCSKFSKKLM